jgi:hypothetical protein
MENEFDDESAFDDFVRREITYRGAKVHLLLATPSKQEGIGIIRAVGRYMNSMGGVDKIEGETDEQHEERQEKQLNGWDDYCKKQMLAHVTLERPLKRRTKPGGTPVLIESTEDLFANTDRPFCTAVVMHLYNLCMVGDTEAKSSGSPSTSTVAAGRISIASPAPSTDDEASPDSSTVPEPTTEAEPSSVPV